MPDDKPKRTYPSGAAKRKMRKERERQDAGRRMTAATSWMQQDAYKGVGDQWDPDAPPSELPIYGTPPATLIATLQSTLTALEAGTFFQAATLWDGMLRDDRITATLGVRIAGVFGEKLVLRPGTEDNTTAVTVAEDAEKRIRKMLPTPQLTQLQRYALGLSVGIAHITAVQTKTRDVTIQTWNPRYLRWDWMARKYFLITQNRGEIAIEYGDPEWIIWEPFGPHGWLHGALIRPLMLPYAIRHWTRTWWARYQEVHGEPIRLGIIPANRDPADERIFLAQLSDMAHEAVIRLPQGEEGNKFDVRLLEAATDSWAGFEHLLQHCDDSIAIVLLGQRQSTTGQGGLGSQEKAGESTMLRIHRQDALIADPLREQVLEPWTADNYGSPELAPFLEWQIEPETDRNDAALTDWHVGQALVQFKTARAPLDTRAYLEERGYPLLTPEQEKAMKAEAIAEAQAAMGDGTPPGKFGKQDDSAPEDELADDGDTEDQDAVQE